MPIETATIHTFTCNEPDCDTKKVVAGELEQVKTFLEMEYWVFNQMIFGHGPYDLCPFHANEIRDLLGIDYGT